MLHPTSILPEILRSRSSKDARHRRTTLRVRRRALCGYKNGSHWTGAVGERRLDTERAGCHALKAKSERTAHVARADERRSIHERGAPRRAVVIHVRDRDPRQAQLVERCLTRRGFAIDVANECCLYGVVRDPFGSRTPGMREDTWFGWTTEDLPASRSAFVAASKPIYVPALRITIT
jgi:hypothetical protein